MTPVVAKPDEPDKRSAILDAALELFVERGYYGTAVPAVADRARVGAGTIYRYFKSKEELVNSLYRHWKGHLATFVMAGLSPAGPPREQFHQLWVRLADFLRTNPKVFAFLELHHHASYLDDESRRAEQRVLDLATSFVARLQTGRIIKPIHPQVIIAIVYWAFVGLGRCAHEGRLTLDDANLADAERCIWEAIRI